MEETERRVGSQCREAARRLDSRAAAAPTAVGRQQRTAPRLRGGRGARQAASARRGRAGAGAGGAKGGFRCFREGGRQPGNREGGGGCCTGASGSGPRQFEPVWAGWGARRRQRLLRPPPESGRELLSGLDQAEPWERGSARRRADGPARPPPQPGAGAASRRRPLPSFRLARAAPGWRRGREPAGAGFQAAQRVLRPAGRGASGLGRG